MVSAVFNYVPQPAAMTFAFFSSVIILLLCSTDDIYPAKLHYTSLQKHDYYYFVIYKPRLQLGKFFLKVLTYILGWLHPAQTTFIQLQTFIQIIHHENHDYYYFVIYRGQYKLGKILKILFQFDRPDSQTPLNWFGLFCVITNHGSADFAN